MDLNAPNRGSPNVFVGNIPYDQSEEQLKEIFSEVGKVVDFRLVFDPETGKPKGYGFCQYEDSETAASAIRNLSGVTVSGRPLRVDYGGMDHKGSGNASTRQKEEEAAAITSSSTWSAPPPPPNEIKEGPPPASGQSATEAIKDTLGQMQANQLLDTLTQFRTFSLQFPDQAKNVLTTRPQLAYALLQAMAMVNIGTPANLARLVPDGTLEPPSPAPASDTAAAAAPAAPTTLAAPASYAAPMASPWSGTPAPTAPVVPAASASASYSYPAPGTRYGTPPVATPPIAAPAATVATPAAPVAPSPAAPAGLDLSQFPPEQRAILEQVLALPQDQIDTMDPEQRATIISLKQQLGVA